jgi:tetratricopeptide (TPR) repeat protein
MAHREGPQLLDFNLAQEPSRPDGATAAQRGGTLPYMAPEQLRAFLDPSAWGDVKSAADIYSLGLVLRELVTGRPPEVPTSKSSLPRNIQAFLDQRSAPLLPIREINPGVPPALESIIGKCLEFDTSNRYATAKDLAEDLQRFMDRKPLKIAPNISAIERGVNWIYRNRQLLSAMMAFFSVTVVLFLFMPPTPNGGREEFKTAEKYLDSDLKEDLELAKAAFEKLRVKYPNSAEVALGQGLTLWKLGDPKDRLAINNLMREVLSSPEAEDVLEERLTKDEKSLIVLLNLGCVLTSKGKFDRAREMLDRAIKIDAGSFSTLNALGDLESKTHHPEAAIAQFERAIKVGSEKSIEAWRIYEIRRAALIQYQILVDEKLSHGEKGAAFALLVGMKEAVRGLGSDLERMTEEDLQPGFGRRNRPVDGDSGGSTKPNEDQTHVFYFVYFQGYVYSVGAALENDPAKSRDLLVKAKEQLGMAKEAIASESGGEARNMQLQWLQDQEGKLRSREALLKSREALTFFL